VTDDLLDLYTAAYFNHHRVTELPDHDDVAKQLVTLFHPTDVLDVACATGNILSGIREHSESNVYLRGVDSPRLVEMVRGPSSEVVLAPFFYNDELVPVDLRKLDDKIPGWAICALQQVDHYRLDIAQWDLVICTEAAEHVPESTGIRLVELLTRISPLILWSAAVPGQGGTGHITERPREFWMEQFGKHGYSIDERTERLDAMLRAGSSWKGRLQVFSRRGP